jgi:hypothetical protein
MKSRLVILGLFMVVVLLVSIYMLSEKQPALGPGYAPCSYIGTLSKILPENYTVGIVNKDGSMAGCCGRVTDLTFVGGAYCSPNLTVGVYKTECPVTGISVLKEGKPMMIKSPAECIATAKRASEYDNYIDTVELCFMKGYKPSAWQVQYFGSETLTEETCPEQWKDDKCCVEWFKVG